MHRIDFARRDPRVVDLAMALTLLALMGLVGGLFRAEGHRPFDGWAYALTGLICLPLAARRAAPMTVLLTSAAAYVVYAGQGYLPGLHLWSPIVAFYSLAALKPPRVTAIGAGVAAGVMVASSLALHAPLFATLAQAVAVPAVAWALGNVSRQLEQRNRQLAEATAQLEYEQRRNIEHAVGQERLRIARELHDVVAHHMSMISMQAGLAGYVFDSDPETARTAVGTIGATSRETLDEMRRLLVLLRESDLEDAVEAPHPAPGLNLLPALADRAGAAGVDVELTTGGELATLPSGLQLAVYRVVQEALTNVLKHAGRCRAEITVRREPGVLRATVRNDGAPAGRTGTGGFGLTGMRERAKLYGGTLTAGPRPDGGFAVELTIPLPRQ
ncbi:sensor histidine kinase [Amycolatopsis sp. A133]|uniref:sensor histidine kinase n=1 Tax=Amycolatopsis sp. A133 TaxID=3064472 RepID=UPI0027F3B796|nr:sensor histidine kinase [Amycolatopsis sp. A133]MDQ7809474.1 sensor histidine kinase [Amycolatopsis sp. A133]